MPSFNFQVTPSGPPKFEPFVAINMLDPNIMVAVAVDTRTGVPLIGLYRSIDGGANWSNTLLNLPAGFTGAEAPAVAYQFPSTFIVSAHVFPGASSGTTVVYISADNGITFSNPTIVGPGYGLYINNDETNVTVDNSQASPYLGNIYVTYNHQFNVANTAGSVAFIQRSKDGGDTWDQPILISDEADQIERPAVTVNLTGIVYAAYLTVSPVSNFMLRRSLDGGATFDGPTSVSSVDLVPSPLPVPGYGFRVLTFPAISVDTSNGPFSGRVYGIFQDYRLGYSDIFMCISDDNGLSFSQPVSITNATPGSQNFFPEIDVDPLTGVVNIIYYSNQLSGYYLDVFVARSINGGESFTNTRITTTSFDPNAGSATPIPLIGDYIDIISVPPGGYIGIWTDTRTGSLTIFSGYNTDVIT